VHLTTPKKKKKNACVFGREERGEGGGGGGGGGDRGLRVVGGFGIKNCIRQVLFRQGLAFI